MNEELSALEARLSQLSPAGGPDAGELMYRAGLAAGARGRRTWQALAAACVCLAAAAGVLNLALPPTRTVEIERVVYVPAPASPEAPHASPGWDSVAATPATMAAETDRPAWMQDKLSKYSYLRMRDEVLAHGLGALPASKGGSRGAENPRKLLNELLGG